MSDNVLVVAQELKKDEVLNIDPNVVGGVIQELENEEVCNLEPNLMDDINGLAWEENLKFKRFDSDSRSFEIDDLTQGNSNNLGKEEVNKKDEFEEDDLNQQLVETLIKERTENKLYDIFKKKGLIRRNTSVVLEPSTPLKRKHSPGETPEDQTPKTPKLLRRGVDVQNSPQLRKHSLAVDPKKMPRKNSLSLLRKEGISS